MPNPQDQNGEPKELHVYDAKNLRFIQSRKIIWIEARREYCMIHVSGEPSCLVSKNLNKLLRELPRDMFIRIHRSAAINKMYIAEYCGSRARGDGYVVKLTNDIELNVAWRRKDEFIEVMQHFPSLYRES